MNSPTCLPIPLSQEDLTLDWFNKALAPHDILVENFIIHGDATEKRGCLGSLTRVSLEIRKKSADPSVNTEKMGIVLKSLPSDPAIRAYVIEKGYSQNEVQMYLEVLPAIEKFLDSRGVSPSNRFSYPKCFFGQETSSTAENSKPEDYNYVLILEDLVGASSYKFWEEGAGRSFDWDHASAAIRNLALLHASSLAYKLHQGFGLYAETFSKFIKHTSEDSALDHYIASGFKATRDVFVEAGDPVPEGLMEHLSVMEEKFKQIVIKMIIEYDEKEVNVIRHMDLHFFNIAFAYDQNDNCVDAKWFDFQNCSEGRPMTDLAFLLILNCESEYSTVNVDKPLTLYYETFQNLLKEAKIEANYSFEAMQKEFKRFKLPAIIHIISGAPVWVCGADMKANQVSKERLKTAITFAYEHKELEIPPTIN